MIGEEYTLAEKDLRRFWGRVDKKGPEPKPGMGPCWLWTWTLDEAGYGKFCSPRRPRNARAHRVSFQLAKGRIGSGLVIGHLCRVKHCVNPAHLEAVTVGLNTLRGLGPTAQNATKTECTRGHALTPENTFIRKCRGRLERKCWICRRERYRGLKALREMLHAAESRLAAMTAERDRLRGELERAVDLLRGVAGPGASLADQLGLVRQIHAFVAAHPTTPQGDPK